MKLTALVFVLVAVVLIALIIAIVIAKRRRTSTDELKIEWPFYAKHILSKPEQVLYHRLVTALPEYIVLAQVQASRVLGVKKGFNFCFQIIIQFETITSEELDSIVLGWIVAG